MTHLFGMLIGFTYISEKGRVLMTTQVKNKVLSGKITVTSQILCQLTAKMMWIEITNAFRFISQKC